MLKRHPLLSLGEHLSSRSPPPGVFLCFPPSLCENEIGGEIRSKILWRRWEQSYTETVLVFTISTPWSLLLCFLLVLVSKSSQTVRTPGRGSLFPRGGAAGPARSSGRCSHGALEAEIGGGRGFK